MKNIKFYVNKAGGTKGILYKIAAGLVALVSLAGLAGCKGNSVAPTATPNADDLAASPTPEILATLIPGITPGLQNDIYNKYDDVMGKKILRGTTWVEVRNFNGDKAFFALLNGVFTEVIPLAQWSEIGDEYEKNGRFYRNVVGPNVTVTFDVTDPFNVFEVIAPTITPAPTTTPGAVMNFYDSTSAKFTVRGVTYCNGFVGNKKALLIDDNGSLTEIIPPVESIKDETEKNGRFYRFVTNGGKQGLYDVTVPAFASCLFPPTFDSIEICSNGTFKVMIIGMTFIVVPDGSGLDFEALAEEGVLVVDFATLNEILLTHGLIEPAPTETPAIGMPF